MSSPEEIDILIVGAGVLGLSVARELAREFGQRHSIFVIDRHWKYGQEASSHNSEVIHAGIYYPTGSYKAESCVRGRELLYAFCNERSVPHQKCGKYILTEKSRTGELESLYSTGTQNGAPLELVDYDSARAAIWSPESGIIDSHSFMAALESEAQSNGVPFLYGVLFDSVLEADSNSNTVRLIQVDGSELIVRSRVVINCGGLGSAKVLQKFAPQSPYEIRPCRGRYYSLSSRWTGQFKHLLYPLPDPKGGLGVHVTFDLSGQCRLGPDVDWSQATTADPQDMGLYKHDASDELLDQFFTAGRRLLPDLRKEDLSADYVGVRAKLFRDEKPLPEFTIVDETARSSSIHLLGIESPGLTAAFAIAQDVLQTVQASL